MDVQSQITNLLILHSRERHKEILDVLYDVHKVLESAIDGTPTGDVRNSLCDANIMAVKVLMENHFKI